METGLRMTPSNSTQGLTSRRRAGMGFIVALSALAATGLSSPGARAAQRGLEATDELSAPRMNASILTLDFDPRGGATVVGITSSAPLGNHTIYDANSTTVVVEIPDVDVSRLEPTATIGTPQVQSVNVTSVQHGSTTTARFEITRAVGARRSVAIDPCQNPGARGSLTFQGARTVHWWMEMRTMR